MKATARKTATATKTRKPSTSTAIARPAPRPQPLVIRATGNPVADMLAAIAQAATNKAVDPRKMREMLEIQKDLMKMQAEREFKAAMHAAIAAMPEIPKLSKGHNSAYAKYEHMSRLIDPIIKAHGFAPSFGMADSPLPNHYRIVCTLHHTGGHDREYFFDLPPDDVGPKGEKNKTPTHAAGSSGTYGQRRLLAFIFNLKFVGMDDDGNNGKLKFISEKQAADLRDLIETVGADERKVCEAFQITILAELPANRLREAQMRLQKFGDEQQGRK